MRKLIIMAVVAMGCLSANAQYRDSASVILTSKIPYRNVFSNKIIGDMHKGDTIYLKNIRVKPYFLVEYKDKPVLVSPKDLDSAIYIQDAVLYMHNLVNKISMCIRKFGKKYGIDVAYKDIKIGMTEDMVVYIKDGKLPTNINTSHYSFGTEAK